MTPLFPSSPPISPIPSIMDTQVANPPQSTKAGVTVGRLRSNANRDIARIASEIVSKWKKHVDAAKDAKRHKDATASPNPAPLTSPAPPPSSLNQPYTGNTEKRHFRTDGVDLKRTGNPTRDNTVGVLYNGLAYQSTESVEEVVARAVEIEAAMFRAFKGSDNQAYRTKGRALFTALKRKDNLKLRRRVLAGAVAADRLVTLSDRDLASEEQRARDEELEKENMKKAQVPMAEKSISDQLKCGKCGQKKVSYTQAQTRSADEPMTTFCECTVCGNRWKVKPPLPPPLPLLYRLYTDIPPSSHSRAIQLKTPNQTLRLLPWLPRRALLFFSGFGPRLRDGGPLCIWLGEGSLFSFLVNSSFPSHTPNMHDTPQQLQQNVRERVLG